MIKVNLLGAAKKQQSKVGASLSKGVNLTPIFLLLIVAGFGVGGYWWYSTLTAQAAQLDSQNRALEVRKAALEAVIKQDQVYESRKKMLENRIKVIEGLQKNQVSPVMA